MIIFFYGPDGFRLQRAIKEIKNKFIREKDPQENSITTIEADTIDLKTFNEKTSTISLFNEKRLIIINDLFKNKKETIFNDILPIMKALEKDEGAIAVFKEIETETKTEIKNKNKTVKVGFKGNKKKIFEFLKSQKYSQEFKKIEGPSLKVFIKNELEKYNKKISAEAADLLISYFFNDLWTLSSELKKLALSVNNDVISTKDIKDGIQEVFSENIFALSDAIGTKNKNLIFSILEKQKKAGLENEQIFSLLRGHFKNLLLIKIESEKVNDSLKIANSLKLHPFVVKKGLSQVRNFKKEDLKNIFNRLMAADYNNKKGLSSLENELFLVISEL